MATACLLRSVERNILVKQIWLAYYYFDFLKFFSWHFLWT